MWTLPRVIRQIASHFVINFSLPLTIYSASSNSCKFQYFDITFSTIIIFSSWISWFPLLFYTTIYVGDLHKQEFYSTILTNSSNPSIDDNFDTRILDAEATRSGSRALFFSALLTLSANVILPFFVSETKSNVSRASPYAPNGMQLSLHNLTPTTSKRASLLQWFSVLQLHLSTLWAVSQAVFASCMFATLSVSLQLNALHL